MTPLPGLAFAPDLDGTGVWGLQLEAQVTGTGQGLVISHVHCGETTQTVTLPSATPGDFGDFHDFSVDEAGKACVPTRAGLWCGQLPMGGAPAGSMGIDVPVAAFVAQLPPADTLHSDDLEALPVGATFARLELTSVVRSKRFARSFVAGYVVFRHPLGAELPLHAGVIFEVTGQKVRLLHGPDVRTRGRVRQATRLFLDDAAGLVYTDSTPSTVAPPTTDGTGERRFTGPAIGVFAADGHASWGVINWQVAWVGLRAELAVGAPDPSRIPSLDGVYIHRVSVNPKVQPGGAVWPLTLDPAAFDMDGEGLTAEREALAGSDPLRADTDSGGLSDAMEVVRGASPLDAKDDHPEAGRMDPQLGDYVTTLLRQFDPDVIFLGSALRFGRAFCGDAACAEKLRAVMGNLTYPTLAYDARGVYGYDGAQLVERRFDGTTRSFVTFPNRGLLVPFPTGFLLAVDGTYRFYHHDGTFDAIDLHMLACGGSCTPLLGNGGFSVVSQDAATDDVVLTYLGNEELMTYVWHPDRGLRVAGRNALMPEVGADLGVLMRCPVTSDGSCLGTYMTAGGSSFVYHVNGRTLQADRPIRMITNGSLVSPLWQDTFAGFATLQGGQLADTHWVRVEDRIEPGDVITMDGAFAATSKLRLGMFRLDRQGGVLPLYGDAWDQGPGAPPSIFPGLPLARGLGAAPDGRLCFVGGDGVYRELASPDDRGRPTKVGAATEIVNAVDCEFDAGGVAHVLVATPPSIVLVDSRLPDAIVRTVPLPGLSTAPTHLSLRGDGTAVVSAAPGPAHCIQVATGTDVVTGIQPYATTRGPNGHDYVVDADSFVKPVVGDLCQATPASLALTFPAGQLGPSPFFDIVARPDGRLVAQGQRQLLLTPPGSLDAVGESVPTNDGVNGPLALIPGGTWTNPWAWTYTQPDFGSAGGAGGGTGTAADGGDSGGGGCRALPSAGVRLDGLGAAVLVLLLVRRRAQVNG